jgi:hypothetical protein
MDNGTTEQQSDITPPPPPRRARQIAEIARHWAAGDTSRVQALAAEHLAEFPRDHVVRWFATQPR